MKKAVLSICIFMLVHQIAYAFDFGTFLKIFQNKSSSSQKGSQTFVIKDGAACSPSAKSDSGCAKK